MKLINLGVPAPRAGVYDPAEQIVFRLKTESEACVGAELPEGGGNQRMTTVAILCIPLSMRGFSTKRPGFSPDFKRASIESRVASVIFTLVNASAIIKSRVKCGVTLLSHEGIE